MRRFPPVLVVGIGLLTGCAAPAPKVELLVPVNALCTTCDDFIRCDAASANAAVYDPSFDLYRLEPKGTLAQLATVWQFLIQLVHTREEDQRPLSTYQQRRGYREAFERKSVGRGEAHIDLVRHRIDLPEGWIDQVNGEWHGRDDSLRGSCRVLTPVEGRGLLKLFTDRRPAGDS